MHFFCGELTQPEITILKITMKYSLRSSNDLLQLFGPRNVIPDDKLVPTLIYSTTQNLTKQVMKVVNDARRVPGGENVASSLLICQYHSTTGNLEKVDFVEDFENAIFPMILCTMALGLGQNWKQVRRVFHVGQGDPASIFQMIGRCGRGRNPSLVILFVEATRKKGKNSVDDFVLNKSQSDDNRMDGLAITPVCLWVAFALDNV
jgi:Lhr-like helicase